MTQESVADDVDALVRHRIRGLRMARGWTLDALARRCHLSPSTLSRIETGHRRVALDQLVPIARALGTTLDHLVQPVSDTDVVIRPEPHPTHPGVVTWLLSRDRAENGVHVAKMRMTPHPGYTPELRVHPGHEWFTVLSGTVELRLGDRVHHVEAGEAAEFDTMTPHMFTAHRTVTEILTIFDRDAERVHLTGE